MLDELVQALREAPSRPLALKVVFDLEDFLTPAEFQAALPVLNTLDGPARDAINSSPVVAMLRREPGENYSYEPVAPGVRLYRGADSPAGRGLVVLLSGRHYRPMMAVSIFLQHLPAKLFDVLLLHDATNSHYTEGVAGYADSLMALTQRVHAEYGATGYARVYHYGVSSGGFPALRMGLMADAHRSIAIGGLFQWPIHRLQSGENVVAFDPICACNAGRGSRLVCVHAALERDITHARRVVGTVKARGVRLPGIEEHNVLFPMFHNRRLREFNQRLFGYLLGPDGDAQFVEGFGV